MNLNLADAAAVRQAYLAIESSVTERAGREIFQGATAQLMLKAGGYELIVPPTMPAQSWAPSFGSGGELVEVYRDRALALPPLNSTLAHRLPKKARDFQSTIPACVAAGR